MPGTLKRFLGLTSGHCLFFLPLFVPLGNLDIQDFFPPSLEPSSLTEQPILGWHLLAFIPSQVFSLSYSLESRSQILL